MVAKRKIKDQYIVGTFTWAMTKMKDGNKLRRRGWAADSRPIARGDKMYKPSALDKRSIDWEIVIAPPLPIDMPADDLPFDEPEGQSPFIAVLALIMFVVLMIGAALYAHGSYKFPLF